MKTRYSESYENDSTPSRAIAERYREVIRDENDEVSLALLHYRGGEEEFNLGQEYCASDNPAERATGADILAQLGWADATFREESIRILVPLLSDPDFYVIYCAAVALGHRSADSAIPSLLQITDHADALVRYGAVLGLSGQEDSRAIDALIKLCSDEDYDVRNWAVFGLGSQIESDSAEIREALRQALRDEDHEIRGEALVGLALRKDPAIIQELIYEWKGDDISILSLEAAEETCDPRLLHRLQSFTQILSLENDPYFAKRLDDAISACTPAMAPDAPAKASAP